MDKDKYNYAIIGCGNAGKVHCYHFSNNDFVNLIAVSDNNKDSCVVFRKLFKPKSVYSDYNEKRKIRHYFSGNSSFVSS